MYHTFTSAGTQGNSDGLVCTDDLCDGFGITNHTAVITDDNNPCTSDGCSEPTGVYHNSNPGAAGESDGLKCTDDICNSLGVTIHNHVNTDDNNPCTIDGCDEIVGPTHIPESSGTAGATDGLSCTTDLCDGNGNTVHTNIATNDNNLCTSDGCLEPSGVYHNPTLFGTSGAVDNLLCTDDICDGHGHTIHPLVNTDDNNQCTYDACTESDGITHTNTAQYTLGDSDGLYCTEDYCDGYGHTDHPPVYIDDSNPCTIDACSESDGVTHDNAPDGSPGATDFLACTDDYCMSGGTVHSPVSVNDNNPCTADACAEPTGVYHSNTAPGTPGASDNSGCTYDFCDGYGGTNHPPVNTNDNNPCTIDGCDPQYGIISHDPSPYGNSGISDGLNCTADICDGNGNTIHNLLPTNDNNPCTTDGCTEPLGVFHTYTAAGTQGAADANLCTDDLCNGQGVTTHTPVNVNDNIPCTIDACNTLTGAITHTGGSVAAAPGTISGSALVCGNTCITYSISPVAGASSYQ